MFPKLPGQSCPPPITLNSSTYVQADAVDQLYCSTLGLKILKLAVKSQLLKVAQ